MLKEFKDFAMKGNIVDMAIGVIIGGSFGKIVTSLVNDIIMPFFGMLLGKVDFSEIFIALDGGTYPTLEAAKAAGATTINIGIFLNTIIEFLIISFSIFIVVKKISEFTNVEEEEEVASEKTCPYCKTSIDIEAMRCPNCTSQLEEVSN